MKQRILGETGSYSAFRERLNHLATNFLLERLNGNITAKYGHDEAITSNCHIQNAFPPTCVVTAKVGQAELHALAGWLVSDWRRFLNDCKVETATGGSWPISAFCESLTSNQKHAIHELGGSSFS